MKQILSILLFLPILTFSQTERQQKEAVRNGSTPTTSQTPSVRTETQQKLDVRTENNSRNYNFNTTPNYNSGPKPYYYNDYNYQLYNRWNRWGAPMYGFNYYNDWFYYDRFGFRQPARIYYLDNGKVDTIRGQKTNLRFGVGYTFKNEFSGWGTIGNKNYFIAEFSKKIQKNQSTFYPNLTMDKVLPWNDQKLDDLIEGWSFHVGMGHIFNDFGLDFMIGWNQDKYLYQYFDELYVLSNNGKYSFKNYTDDYMSVKIGVIKNINKLSLRGSVDPIRTKINLGIGLNF